jgi:type IV pilus assembly protein PilV
MAMLPMRKHSRRQNYHRGFSLVEVLVALLVLSIGLLGLAALQTTSLKYNTESYFRTQATYLAYDIIDRMRANALGVAGGNYDVPNSGVAATKMSMVDCSGGCDPATLANYDLWQWYTRMGQVLPGSTIPPANLATITMGAGNSAVIEIKWMERDVLQTQRWDIQLQS